MRFLACGFWLVLAAASPLAAAEPIPQHWQKYYDFADVIAESINFDLPDQYALAFDRTAIVDRALAGLEIPEELLDELRNSMAGHFPKTIGTQVHALRKVGNFTVLRVRPVDGEMRAIFRARSAEGGLAYYEFVLEDDLAGRVRAVDFFSHSGGAMMTELMRTYMATALAEERGRGVGVEFADGLIANQKTTSEVYSRLNREQPALALAAWKRLPKRIRTNRLMTLLRIRIAHDLGNDDPDGFAKTVEDFRLRYPGEAAADVLAIDLFVAQKRYADAAASVARLNKAIGGDAELAIMQGRILLLDGNAARARELAEEALEDIPRYLDAEYLLLESLLATKDHAAAAQRLTRLEIYYRQAFDDLPKQPAFVDFVKSPEYRQWLKDREERQKRIAELDDE